VTLEAPFPWFGGKRRVAAEVWARFGDVPNYVEPFFGSGAVLLGRPGAPGTETVNDLDGYVANFWRSIKLAPDATAEWADNPVNENDLHARHVWLLKQRETLRARLEGDTEYHDAKIAGWWAWGISCWIGAGWCSGNGPWWTDDENKLVHLGNAGQGVNRQLVHLGTGKGVNRKLVHLGDWFHALAARLRNVRVCSGDWARVTGPSVTHGHGLTGVFLDPPYADTAGRDANIYAEDSLSVAHDVRAWAIEEGKNPLMRIALCGYDGEHEMPASWSVYEWKAQGGYANLGDGAGRENANRERIWFSPACLGAKQGSLF
jgi:site-specific DNA-adenine methylase